MILSSKKSIFTILAATYVLGSLYVIEMKRDETPEGKVEVGVLPSSPSSIKNKVQDQNKPAKKPKTELAEIEKKKDVSPSQHLTRLHDLEGKALLNTLESKEKEDLILSDENIKKSLSILDPMQFEQTGPTHDMDSWKKQEKEQMYAISHLARVFHFEDFRKRDHVIQRFKEMILTLERNKKLTSLPKHMKKTLVGNAIEMAQIIFYYNETLGQELKDIAKGTRIEALVSLAERRAPENPAKTLH